MSDINAVFIEGNLTRDADFREPKEGFKVAEMAVAINEYYTRRTGEELHSVSFVRVRAYGKTAELCAENAKRGYRIRIKGKLKQDRWLDKDSGKERHRLFVEASEVKIKPAEGPNTDRQNAERDGRENFKNEDKKAAPETDAEKEALRDMADVNMASLSQMEEMEKFKDSVENSGK